jgi:DNA-directed RNA polymerase subunit omega
MKRAKNRFLLVHMAAKRVRQIREGSEYLVSSPKNEDIVVSLREIAAGKVYGAFDNLNESNDSSLEPDQEPTE